ncbi:MAG: FAD-dependent monooxygenase, partial [Acidobacteriaceae bacterium]|nr:FAD-dependent monooxygenase [Acidobacteriaceae bacterium]
MLDIVGGGLAGSAAALAALREGASVRVWEKSRMPRHKVCGEYLSPEVVPVLEDLGVWDAFVAQQPANMRRLSLHFARSEKRCLLPEPAFGLSRYRLDAMLMNCATQRGAQWMQEPAPADGSNRRVLACGRQES